jgi:hypothetical protein
MFLPARMLRGGRKLFFSALLNPSREKQLSFTAAVVGFGTPEKG